MPYEGEFAQYRSLRRLVESERVRELLGSLRVQRPGGGPASLNTIEAVDVPRSDRLPDWVLAVDGSHAGVRVENGYPQAEASYVTVASVLIDVARVRELDRCRPVDPCEIRKTEHAESIDGALPSCNVVLAGERSAKDSLRWALFRVFADHEMSLGGETLLDSYEALLAYKLEGHDQRCPYGDCPVGGVYKKGHGCYPCPCPAARPLYSTDALRIHEGMNLEGTNGAMFAEIMQVWERVWIIHFLRTLERKGWLAILGRLAIVLDGPLAVFGHPAWLSQAISAELDRLNANVRQETCGQDLLWLGIEKTGMFVQHMEDLDRGDGEDGSNLRCGTAVLLDDAYIKEHIVFSNSDKPYGKDTYFGRKFLYKTRSVARIVASLPYFCERDRDVSRADPDQFPRLGDALALLDDLVSSRYPNALSPLVAAHAEAAIPLHLGNRVLEHLAHELMAKERR